jgi:hypothetical protein
VAYRTMLGTLTVDMGRFSGPVTVRWMDPTSGAYQAVAGSPFQNSGQRAFTTPGRNSRGAADWALVLETAPLAAPARTTRGQ